MNDVSTTFDDITTPMADAYNYSDDVGESRDATYYGDIVTLLISPLQLLIGLGGNAICAYVTYLAIDVLTPIASYATILAFVDSAILIVDVASEWLTLVIKADLNRDVISRSDTTCKTFYFLQHFLLHLASWMMVCMSIEVFRLTRRPKLLNYFKSERIIDIFVLLLVVLSTLNVHYFWTYGVSSVQFKLAPSDEEKKPLCTFVAKNLQGYYEDESCKHILEQLHWIIADIVPVAIIVVFLGLLRHIRIRRTRTEQRDRKKPAAGALAVPDGRRELVERAYWILLVMFVAFKVPYMLAREVSDMAVVELRENPAWDLLLAILKAWSNVNFSCKIFIYACSWTFFAKELRKIMTPRRRVERETSKKRDSKEKISKLQITSI